MNLYLVTLSHAAVGKWLVFAASGKSDFDVEGIRTPTIL